MTPPVFPLGLSAALVLVLSAGSPPLQSASPPAQDAEKHVYVTVLDTASAPIDGLTAEHFAVREGGQDRQVLRVEPLGIPMHVAVLVDTSSTRVAPDEAYRSAVIDFLVRLAASGNHVAVYAFGDRAAPVIGFTQDAAQLRAAATGMFGWSHERSHLIDGVDRALRDLAAVEPPRPVIIAIASEAPEASRQTAGGVVKRLIGQSTAFHAISIASATGSGSASAPSATVQESSQRLRGMVASGEGDREREQVLRQGTALTGGSRQRLTSTQALPHALARLTRELSNSYLVTYNRKGSAKVKDLQVGIMLEGVTLRATAAPSGTR